jgi:hypothetical protein
MNCLPVRRGSVFGAVDRVDGNRHMDEAGGSMRPFGFEEDGG